MPPKGKGDQPKANKVAVDKTFGMKNKKGSAAKKIVHALESSKAGGKNPDEKRKQAEKDAREREKIASEKAQKEMAELFKPVQVQKVPFGVDPKSVLCQFFKKGHCEKGKKCKFSHDLAVERKGAKKSLYEGQEEGGEGEDKDGEEGIKLKDDMADWDEEKLRSVVTSKHGNPQTTTDKVCKFFVEAVENGKYGWFWTCPNGGDQCKYKHTLPPGFVLKTKEQRAAEKAAAANDPRNTLTLEDFLESERHKLTGTLTPVTPETFAKWKKERMDKKAAEEEARRRRDDSGRAMFEAGEHGESEDEDDGDDDEGDDLQALRRETEKQFDRREQERLAAEYGYTLEEQEQEVEPPDESVDGSAAVGSAVGNGEGSVNGRAADGSTVELTNGKGH